MVITEPSTTNSVYLSVVNGTGSSYKEVPTGGSAAWTVTANDGYTTDGATFSPSGCGTISGSTVTISNVTGPHTCTVTLQSSDPLKYFTYTGDYAIKKASDYNLDTSNGDYTVLALLSNGTLTFNTSFNADIFMVGGGGGGGYGSTTWSYHGGGGGGGRTTTAKNVVFDTTGMEVVVGTGGAGSYATSMIGGTGGSTSILHFSAAGGTGANGAQAGSGGSGGSTPQGIGTGKPGVVGGSDGSNGTGDSQFVGTGQGTSTRAFGETSALPFGAGGASGGSCGDTTLYPAEGGYYGGGSGGYYSGWNAGSTYYNGGNGIDGTGGGGGGGYNGANNLNGGSGGSGIILIRVHK